MQARLVASICVAPRRFPGSALTSVLRTSCSSCPRRAVCATRPSRPLRQHAGQRPTDGASPGEDADQLPVSPLLVAGGCLTEKGGAGKAGGHEVLPCRPTQPADTSTTSAARAPAVGGCQPPSPAAVLSSTVASQTAALKPQEDVVSGDCRSGVWPRRFKEGAGGGAAPQPGPAAREPLPPSPSPPSGARSRSAPPSTRPAVARLTAAGSLHEQRPKLSSALPHHRSSSSSASGSNPGSSNSACSTGGGRGGKAARPSRAQHRGYLSVGQLSVAIGRAISVQQLDQYVSEHRDVMDQIHVSAALGRLVDLPEGLKRPWLMNALEQMLMEPQLGADVARIEVLIPRNLTASFRAFAIAGRVDSAAFRRLSERLRDGRVLAGCDAQGLATTLWSSATAGCLDAAFAEMLCKAVTTLGLDRCNSHDFANILWACATPGHVDWPLFEAVCQEAVRRSDQVWAPLAVSNSAWALATLATASRQAGTGGVSGSASVLGMLRLLMCQAEPQLLGGTWDAQSMSQLVWALASLDVYGAQFLDAVAEWVLAGGMAGATPQGWCNLLGGYATLRHGAPALFSGAVSLMAPVLPRCSARDLSNVMMTYANAAPPDCFASLLAQVADRFLELLPSATARHISNAAWALAVALGDRQRLSPALAHLAQAVVNEAEGRNIDSYDTKDLRQTSQLYLEMSARACGAARDKVPSLLQVEAAAARQCMLGTTGGNTASVTAAEVHAAMRRMGWDAALQQRSPCNGFNVDIVVTVGGTRMQAWEIDGPSHFKRNDRSARDGATRLRDRCLERSYGRPVISVNLLQDGWDFKSATARRQLLLRLMLGQQKGQAAAKDVL